MRNGSRLQVLTQCNYLEQFGTQPRYQKEMDISDANVAKAVKCALEVRDFTVIVELRADLGGDEVFFMSIL